MKKLLVILLALLVLAVNVGAEAPCVIDESALVPAHQIQFLEDACQDVKLRLDYTPMVVTVDSFGGLTAEEYAKSCYDVFCYDENAMLLLVSISEGEWYILTKGACANILSDAEAAYLGELILPDLREGNYYDAFAGFIENGAQMVDQALMRQLEEQQLAQEADESVSDFAACVVICLPIGFVIAIIAVLIMALKMKTVRARNQAGDYVRAGSYQVNFSRDIFLYSHVTRTPKPKPSSSSGGSSGGRSTGGAGGKI